MRIEEIEKMLNRATAIVDGMMNPEFIKTVSTAEAIQVVVASSNILQANIQLHQLKATTHMDEYDDTSEIGR